MQLLIGVIGSSARTAEGARFSQAVRLGRAIAAHKATLFTLALPGIMHIVAHAAHQSGGTVIGISPAWSRADHESHHLPVDGYDTLIFAGAGLLRCEHEIIQSADALIAIDTPHGSLATAARICDKSKLLGVLTTPAHDTAAQDDASASGAFHLHSSDDPEALVAYLVRAFLTEHGQTSDSDQRDLVHT